MRRPHAIAGVVATAIVVLLVHDCLARSASAPCPQDATQPATVPATTRPGESPSKDLTFKGAGEFELRGTLLMPATADDTRVPAMLLLPGSGPTDRNGNQPPAIVTDLLRQIAERLASDGVATLRFDKRAAHVYASAWPKGIPAMDEFFAFENFVGDAAAAYRWLRTQEGIDPSRVAILGHSEGGLIGLQIASDLASADDRPAGLVLAATAGRAIDVVLHEQIEAALKLQTTNETVRKAHLEQLDRAIDAVKKGEPVPAELAPGLKPLFNPTSLKLLRSYFTIDPAELAGKVVGPVLIVQGDRDAQVSVERDAPRLAKALNERTTGKTEQAVIPEASHNLKPVKGALDPGFQGPVAPAALDAISAWVKANLMTRGT